MKQLSAFTGIGTVAKVEGGLAVFFQPKSDNPQVGDPGSRTDQPTAVFLRPALDKPQVAYKGMEQVYLFAHRDAPAGPELWEKAWLAMQPLRRQQLLKGGANVPCVGTGKPVLSEDWDVDHVFPRCWAEAVQFEYVLLTPIYKTPNRSAGAGLEKAAKKRAELFAEHVDISGDYAYVTAAALAKLLGKAPGSGAQSYPGLEEIQPYLDALQALFAY